MLVLIAKLIRDYLKDEMMHPSSLYTNARPFKIFISLLDKWEIGSPLTEVLIYDALTAIKQSVQSLSQKGEDVGITLLDFRVTLMLFDIRVDDGHC